MATCPVHGWTLIQKFKSTRISALCERVVPIDEWWCRSCGYNTPVPGMESHPSVPAVDPHGDSNTGKLSTRVASSSSVDLALVQQVAQEMRNCSENDGMRLALLVLRWADRLEGK